MISPRGLVVCVGFDDLLAITLPRNMRFMSKCFVVTSPDDERTKSVCAAVPGVVVFETDAFTRHGARFNKGLAMEEAFEYIGRNGWILIWDADILFPDYADLSSAKPDCLNGCNRVMLDDINKWTPDMTWRTKVPYPDPIGIGYFQLFHADAPRIKNHRPWYDMTFAHAGSGDAYFVELWEPGLINKLPFTCLHLGPSATNWFQRVTPRIDGAPVANQTENAKMMMRYLRFSQWGPNGPILKGMEIDDLPPLNRIEIPGYGTSRYEPPHIRQKGRRVKRGFFN